jgi:Tfp pilus assembly protein PilO
MPALDLKEIPAKLTPVIEWAKRYVVMIFIACLVGACGFLVLRISTLASSEPSDDAVAEKLKTVQRPKLDQAAVDKIEQLKDQNVEVQSLFDQARQSPFSE